jgi:hypothetical protein
MSNNVILKPWAYTYNIFLFENTFTIVFTYPYIMYVMYLYQC